MLESRTDWAAVKAATEEELEASIAADPMTSTNPSAGRGWSRACPRIRDIHLRLDEDVLDWSKQAGRGYQARINSVLPAFYEDLYT